MKPKIYGIRNCDTMKKPTWRKIPDAQKADLTEARALALLQQNPSAIRRPIVEKGAELLIGFDPAQFDAAL
jgi:arsenate reductase